MTKLFISHSSQDDGFVRDLRAALADHSQPGYLSFENWEALMRFMLQSFEPAPPPQPETG